MNSTVLSKIACFLLWLPAFGNLAQPTKLSQLPAAYQALLQEQGAYSTYLAPDQINLVLAHHSQYAKQIGSIDSVFNAAGRKLSTLAAMDEARQKYTMLTLINLRNQESHPIVIADAEILDLVWSPDGLTSLCLLNFPHRALCGYQTPKESSSDKA